MSAQRWVMTQFFKPSFTKNPTLEEIRNGRDHNLTGISDATDMDVAKEILLRANLSEHPRYAELCEMFADALSLVDDPAEFVNPNAHFVTNKAAKEAAEQNAKEQKEKEAQQAKVDAEKTKVPATAKSPAGTKDSK